MEQRIFTTHHISKMLHCDRKAVCTWIDQGLMPGYRTPGGHRRVTESDLLAFLRARQMPLPEDLCQPRTRILIADHEEVMPRLICRALNRSGHLFETRTAQDGIAALIEIGRFMPHIVILDVMMPGLDGIAVCRKIKADPRTRHIQVIAVSGLAEPERRRKILSCGAVALFTTPFQLDALVDQIEHLCEPRATRPLASP